jgi:hypothetical protein
VPGAQQHQREHDHPGTTHGDQAVEDRRGGRLGHLQEAHVDRDGGKGCGGEVDDRRTCARCGEALEAWDAEEVLLAIRERVLDAEECAAVGARLRDAPVGALWVGPLDLDVRGPHVRVAEGDDLLYEAVITELAERR